MQTAIKYIKISATLPLNPFEDVVKTEKGFRFTPEFVDKIYEAQEEFRANYITFLNDSIGLHNWALKFVAFDHNLFDVLVYVDQKGHVFNIVNILRERPAGRMLRQIYYEGTMKDYLQDKHPTYEEILYR